jgi:antitoxin component YwqK of YwqJK toxin-antitoxin module
MKYFTFLILFFCFAINAIGQIDYPDSGFTNKAEAKNLMVNGVKEGKWVEFTDDEAETIRDTNASFYNLIVYRHGVPYGPIKVYYKSGELRSLVPIINGNLNGVERKYYKNGKLYEETYWKDGMLNGSSKIYYENGKLEQEAIYVNDSSLSIKYYDTTGVQFK